MSELRSYTRRRAIVGLGASGLGLAIATRAGAVPNRDIGTTAAGEEKPDPVSFNSENTMAANNVSLADHPLKGLWLAKVHLPSSPDVPVRVPTVFSPDGTVIMTFPAAEQSETGMRVKGMAIGSWEALDFQSAHFTVVQAVCDGQGSYLGTVTIDGYPKVQAGGVTFEDHNENSRLTVRDAYDLVSEEVSGAFASNMVGSRMSVGNAGFAAGDASPAGIDPRTPD